MEIEFKVANWNIGGAKYLEVEKDKRDAVKKEINKNIRDLVRQHCPQVITFQEVVHFGKSKDEAEDIIDESILTNYDYHMYPLIDTISVSNQDKWDKIKEIGEWPDDYYFAQGNAFAIQKNLNKFPVWDLTRDHQILPRNPGPHLIEKVALDSGLYFGDRDTEPRAALVAHIILNPLNNKPLDIFVINTHLTTIMMEREGIPQTDNEATRIRLGQIDIIFNGIISRYNTWKQKKFPRRGERRRFKEWETSDRYQPVWILAGDFNFTEKSFEFETIERMNFVDVVKEKGFGTKASGVGKRASLTVDYIFAGPKFNSLDPFVIERGVIENRVYSEYKSSDHYPMIASIPISIPE